MIIFELWMSNAIRINHRGMVSGPMKKGPIGEDGSEPRGEHVQPGVQIQRSLALNMGPPGFGLAEPMIFTYPISSSSIWGNYNYTYLIYI